LSLTVSIAALGKPSRPNGLLGLLEGLSGDSIALRTLNGSYVGAEGGGGGYVVAHSADRGPWETFEIELR
jgi:hypothetical protein